MVQVWMLLENILKSKTLRTNSLHHRPKGRCFSQKFDKKEKYDINVSHESVRKFVKKNFALASQE